MFSNIRKLYFVNFLISLHFFGAISVPFFIQWIEISYTQLFLLEAWFVGWIFLLEIPTGIIADKYGRKTSIALGMFCAALTLVIFGFTKSYTLLYVAEFIGALGAALFSGADNALLYDSLVAVKRKDEARAIIGKYESMAMLGMLVAFPIGSVIAGTSILGVPGFPLTMLLSAVFVFVGACIALTLQEPKQHKHEENFVTAGIQGVRYIFENPRLRAFALNSSLISAATFFMFWFYQAIAGSAGISVTYFGFIGASFLAIGWVCLQNLKRIEQLISLPVFLLTTALLPGILYLVLAVIVHPVIVVVGVILVVVLGTVREPALKDFINQQLQSSHRATVLSGIGMIRRGAILVFYPLIGFLADIGLPVVLVFLGLLTLVITFITRLDPEHIV